MIIDYRFRLDGGEVYDFRVDFERKPDFDSETGAFWSELAFNQCTNCPLSLKKTRRCPAAADLETIIHTFKNLMSYHTATVDVVTPERTISKQCDVQTGLRSLLGVVMATSGCPILAQLRGMALSHLPFANLEETVVRTAGAYLLKQYFILKDGGKPDLEMKGLETLYKQLETLDSCFKKRIDAASERDANMNAIGSLGFLAMGVTFSLEDMLRELKGYSIPTELAKDVQQHE